MSDKFLRRFPVTSFFLGLNLLVFLALFFDLLDPDWVVYYPGELGVRTFAWSFVHIALSHLVFNLIATMQMGMILESAIGARKFLLITALIWLLVSFSAFLWIDYPLVGFSGVLMGWVSFGLLTLWHHQMFRQALGIWLVLNIVIGLLPGVSFLGHALGMIAGGVVWGVMKLMRQ